MGRRLSDEDRQWLHDHPDFHLLGTTHLGRRRNTNSDRSNTRALNENDQHVYEMHRTFSQRLAEAEAYESIIED